tara:strand:- start:883 stop:1386 length:504 start_codon:yes stop_codon:yes gene_type:complete
MRKLNILKAIIDFLWIFSTPLILLFIGFAVMVFFVDLSGLDIKINAITFNKNHLLTKILFSIAALNYLLIIAALYYFKKTLSYFIRVKVFEDVVINSFQKTGNLLFISGVISLVISFIGNIYLLQKTTFELGLNQHIVIICLGLFFMVLSEIFKIAKNAKQENDLTI